MSKSQTNLQRHSPDGDASTAQANDQLSNAMTLSLDSNKQFADVEDIVPESGRIHFLGLEDNENLSYPDDISPKSFPYGDDPVTFTDIIDPKCDEVQLPHAKSGELRSFNNLISEDGSLDIDQIKQHVDVDALPVDPEEVVHDTAMKDVPSYTEIIDPRRKALNALGFEIDYRWQVASDNYTIINPDEAYWPAYKSFMENGEAANIFGWVDYSDYGGNINIYILFAERKIETGTPEYADDEDDDGLTEQTEDDPYTMYVGLQTGYNFAGTRALDLKLFAYDPHEDLRFYHIGERKSRKHIGDPDDDEHERKNGRVPISDWWDREYDNLLTWTDNLTKDIEKATKITLDFSASSDIDYGLADFYSYLDIADSYIHGTEDTKGAVKRAEEHSPNSSVYTMWTLFYALSETLENEFQGESHASSAQFKVYADIAKRILRSPETTVLLAHREHEKQQQQDQQQNQSKLEEVMGVDERQKQIDDVDDIDGVATEDELNLLTKRDIAQEKQKNLFDFENDD